MTSQEIYKLVSENVTGWCLPQKVDWFYKIYSQMASVAATGDKYPHEHSAIETGVFYGMSAIAQGLIIKELGLKYKLYAIDAWSKEASIEGSNSELNNEWWSKLDYDEIYKTFLRSIQHFELQDIVIPVRLKSQAAASIMPSASLIHLDSNHSFEVVSQEIELYAPKATNYIILDDERWREMNNAGNKLFDYGFSKEFSYDKDGQSFGVFKRK